MKAHANNLPPDKVVFTDIDVQAKRLFLELGVLGRFQFPTDLKSNVFFYSIDDHATHWILGARFRDFPAAKDNGYLFIAWPKKKVSAAEANQLAHNLMKKNGFTPERRNIFIGGAPKPNS